MKAQAPINLSLIEPKTLKYAGVGLAVLIVGVGGYFGIKKWKKAADKKKFADGYNQYETKTTTSEDGTTTTTQVETQSSQAKKLAVEFYSSFFVSGYTWLPDGTDEDAIGLAAQRIFDNKIPFADVVKAYKLQYQRNLHDDLAAEVSVDVMRNFNEILSGKLKIVKGYLWGYNLEKGSLAGLQGINPMIYTIDTTPIYNLNNQLIATTKKGKKVGQLISTIETPKGLVFLFDNRGQTLAIKGSNTIKFA